MVTTTVRVVKDGELESEYFMDVNAPELWAGMGCNEAQALADYADQIEDVDRDGRQMVITLKDGRHVVLTTEG